MDERLGPKWEWVVSFAIQHGYPPAMHDLRRSGYKLHVSEGSLPSFKEWSFVHKYHDIQRP